MAGRKIGNEQEARRCLKAAELAGRDRAAWARSQGIDPRSLNAWRVNLERRGEPAPRLRSRPARPRLVELVPVPTSSSAVGERSARYSLRVGELVLELGDDFNEQTVRRLVGLLRSC